MSDDFKGQSPWGAPPGGGGSGNGHQWNGMTTSLSYAVNEGDYVSCRFSANSDSSFYLYGGGNYNSWQVFYLPGAQNNQG